MDSSFDWSALKSGTDLRGVASGDARAHTLTEERARQIGAGFSLWLSNMQKARVVVAVGRDPRISGEKLARALREGLCSTGARVLDVGLSTTPALFEITQHPLTRCDGAVMVTASHLPGERNGFKFITQTGGLDGKQLDELLAIISKQTATHNDDASEYFDFQPYYLESLTAQVYRALGEDFPFAELHVIVDASGGSGGFYARWLENLGANTTGSLYLQPDGLFSGHLPNPEDAAAMRSLTNAVLDSGADIGVILDADCDRAALVAHDGSHLNRERLIALCADMVIKEEPGAAIVTDSVTSPSLTQFIERRGGKHRRWKRGYKNVIGEAERLNNSGISCPLAMETSGHAAFRSNRYLDDGMALATRLIIEAVVAKRSGMRLIDRVADFNQPLEDCEWRIAVELEQDRICALEKMKEWLNTEFARSVYISPSDEPEGVRAERIARDGWFLLRASLHDPLLVWSAQSYAPGVVELMRHDLTRACSINLSV
ncbi:MAG: phosphomannomutase/phosphoglucomutase [Oscillospiraceae bacterium]|jgi:phosphomannomutase|nr:phosphomannomutase/phosphoglucomutase [Oscillospiraceae bacterium]